MVVFLFKSQLSLYSTWNLVRLESDLICKKMEMFLRNIEVVKLCYW